MEREHTPEQKHSLVEDRDCKKRGRVKQPCSPKIFCTRMEGEERCRPFLPLHIAGDEYQKLVMTVSQQNSMFLECETLFRNQVWTGSQLAKIHAGRRKYPFNSDNPTMQEWNDGCIRLTPLLLLSEMMTSFRYKSTEPFSEECVELIWQLFHKCCHTTKQKPHLTQVSIFNSCRVMAGCVLICLKWIYDDLPRETIYFQCLPMALKTSLTSPKHIAALESHIYFAYLDMHIPLAIRKKQTTTNTRPNKDGE